MKLPTKIPYTDATRLASIIYWHGFNRLTKKWQPVPFEKVLKPVDQGRIKQLCALPAADQPGWLRTYLEAVETLENSRKTYQKNYYQKNKERIKKQRAKRYRENKGLIKEQNRRWRDNNPVKARQISYQYYHTHPEEKRAYQREYAKRPEVQAKRKVYQQDWAKRNPEKVAGYRKKCYQKNITARREHNRINSANYRAKKKVLQEV